MSYAVVRTDKMTGTDVRSELTSVRYVANDEFAAIENGNVVKLDGLETDSKSVITSREVYKGIAPTADAPIKDVVLIASPEVMYDERKRELDQFINEAGTISRGYHLHTNDVFSVTIEALDSENTPAVGNLVELQAGTKLKVVSEATDGSTQIGSIIDINVVGRYTYYAIKVN